MTDHDQSRRNNFDPNSSQLPHVAFTQSNAVVPPEVTPYLIGGNGEISQLRYIMPNGQFYVDQQVPPPQPPANNNITSGNSKKATFSTYFFFAVFSVFIPLTALLIFFASLSVLFDLYAGLALLLIFAISFLSCSSRYVNKNRNFLSSWWNGLIFTSLIFSFYVSYNNPYAIVMLSFTVCYMFISRIYLICEKNFKALNTAVLS